VRNDRILFAKNHVTQEKKGIMYVYNNEQDEAL